MTVDLSYLSLLLLVLLNISSVFGLDDLANISGLFYHNDLSLTMVNLTKLLLEERLDDGCVLKTPKSVQNRMEPKGKPLIIFIDMRVRSVRDVPDSGGSFGVDIE